MGTGVWGRSVEVDSRRDREKGEAKVGGGEE